MEFLSTAEMILVAQQVAREYAGMFSWAQGLVQDLAQEGVVAILQGARGYSPTKGDPRAYARGCAWHGAGRYLWRNRGDVVAPFGRGEAPTFETIDANTPGATDSVDALAHLNLASARASEIFRAHDPEGFGCAVALRGMLPAEVAAAAGVPVRRVYTACYHMKQRASQDPTLQKLWEGVR